MPAKQSITDILHYLQNGTDIAATAPQRLVHACAEDISGDGVSLTWSSTKDAPLIVAATNGAAARLELVSFILDKSPQTRCADTNRVISSDLTDVRVEWSDFAREALTVGIRAVSAFPLRLGANSQGVLTLYRSDTTPLTRQQFATALTYTAAAVTLFL